MVSFFNPAMNAGLNQESTVEIYTVSGVKLMNVTFSGETLLPLNLASGMYLAKITSDNKTITKKLIIR